MANVRTNREQTVQNKIRPISKLSLTLISKLFLVRNNFYEDVSLHVYFHASLTLFHIKTIAQGLVLKQRQKTNRKWLIVTAMPYKLVCGFCHHYVCTHAMCATLLYQTAMFE